jgi:predicted signal transduction protein with EAL and GGDEF domain
MMRRQERNGSGGFHAVALLLSVSVAVVVGEAIVRLGTALGVSVIAEGIEDVATSKRLVQLGCPLGQGYLFGRPEPIAELSARFAPPIRRGRQSGSTLNDSGVVTRVALG